MYLPSGSWLAGTEPPNTLLHSTSLLNPQEYNLCGDGPDNSSVVRVCLVGPGLCTESTHALADILIAVVAFIEYESNFDYAKQCFPNAQGFYDIRVVNKDLENKTLAFPTYDLLVYTAPCYRQPSLSSGGPKLKSSHPCRNSAVDGLPSTTRAAAQTWSTTREKRKGRLPKPGASGGGAEPGERPGPVTPPNTIVGWALVRR